MAAKDIYHEHVKTALIKDGWQITHDPLRLDFGEKYTLVDLGAERFLAAEKDKLKIAVEIKSFVGKSTLDDLEKALGQFVLYHDILKENEPERILFLAVRESVFDNASDAPYWNLLLQNQRLRLIVFDPATEEITQWIPQIS